MFNILRLAPATNTAHVKPAEQRQKHDFTSLRTSLTTNSIVKMLVLAAVASAYVYGAAAYYLAYIDDRSLLETMAIEYEALGVPLPDDLQHVEKTGSLLGLLEEAYDGEDAVELVRLFDQSGKPLANAKGSSLLGDWNQRDPSALTAASENGADFRSVYLDENLHARLYTRALPAGAPAAFAQFGHLLTNEDRFKHQMLLILSVSGVFITLASGGLSWWLTGKSLRSTQYLWEQQQTFIANASHELRTPLTLIRASTQVLQLNLDETNPQRQLLDDVLNETDYMSRLVDDMLVLSRLDAGQLQLDLAPIDLAELLRKVAHSFVALAGERGVRINVAGAEGIVLADRTRIWQVLLILIDNALRHTPAGGSITLESKMIDDIVQITVTDNGRGIPPADLPHVFERFFKASNSRSDKRSAGLGLSIAKPLVTLHKGEIDIQSAPGIRTVATIILPAYDECELIEIAPPDTNG